MVTVPVLRAVYAIREGPRGLLGQPVRVRAGAERRCRGPRGRICASRVPCSRQAKALVVHP